MSPRSSAAALVAVGLFSIGTSGCGLAAKRELEELAEAFDDLAGDDPFEATVEATDVPEGSLRAGLFLLVSPATASDGSGRSFDVDLSIDLERDGRAVVHFPGSETGAAMTPLERVEILDGEVEFVLPEVESGLVPIVWVDGDGDDALDVGTQTSEAARALRQQRGDDQYFLSLCEYDAETDSHRAVASARTDEGWTHDEIEEEQRFDWVVVLDRASDAG